MNKQILIFVIFVFVLMFSLIVGCEDDSGTNSNETENPFVGDWTCVERNGIPLGNPRSIEMYFTFLSDSTFKHTVVYPPDNNDSRTGRYMYVEDSITLSYSGIVIHTATYEYKRNLGRLILTREYEDLILARDYGN